MSFRIAGLDPATFAPLFQLSDSALAARAIARTRVAEKPGAPCRISLDDAEIGETVLLLSYEHQGASTPYRQQGPIFVREGQEPYGALGAVPPAMARRPLSLRGFNARHMMINAELCDGAEAASAILNVFANPAVRYIHAHYALRGCFAAAIERH